MSPDQAKALLTDENIRTTAKVLAALDELQGHEFRNNVEKRLKKRARFSNDNLKQGGRMATEGFCAAMLPGNGGGLKMCLSAFINGLQLLHMHPQATSALQECQNFETLTGS